MPTDKLPIEKTVAKVTHRYWVGKKIAFGQTKASLYCKPWRIKNGCQAGCIQEKAGPKPEQ
jgi:hypothetical protein